MLSTAVHDSHGDEVVPGEPLAPRLEHEVAEGALHSANCGLIVHRVGQINYGFRQEARAFARALRQHSDRAVAPAATTLLFDEILGIGDRFHWLVHLKAPNDYAKFIHLVDHDSGLRQIVESDRLPQKGGGNWERMFAEGSFREHVLVPQHGLVEPEREPEGYFVPPARYQLDEPRERQLSSANAGVVIERTVRLRYRYREEGRAFAFAWQRHVNRALAGDVTVLLYEETWGRQDRIYWLIHLRSLDHYQRLLSLGAEDQAYGELFTRPWISSSKGGGTWAATFVEGTLKDTVLVPHGEGSSVEWK